MEILKLDNQLCFPIYTASKVITKAYRPLLQKFGLNYQQYLVLLLLFEQREASMQEVLKRLDESELKLKPELLSMEDLGYLSLHKEGSEILKIRLTEKGKESQTEIDTIPKNLVEQSGFTVARIHALQKELSELVDNFTKK